MANINQLVRRKQNLRMALIGLGISAVGGAAWYLSSAQHAGKVAQTQQQKAPPPNMTGVVSQTFDKKVSDAAVADIQHTASEAEKKLKAFESRLAKMEQREQDYRAKIEEQENELAILRAEQEAMKENSAPELPAGQPAPSFGPGAAVPPPTTFYPPGSGNESVNLAPVTQYQVTPKPEKGLSSMTVDYGEKSAVSNKPPLPYIPSASFAPAVVIEGADANASVTGNSDPSPMQFRLTGLVRMPNDKTYDLTGCIWFYLAGLLSLPAEAVSDELAYALYQMTLVRDALAIFVIGATMGLSGLGLAAFHAWKKWHTAPAGEQ